MKIIKLLLCESAERFETSVECGKGSKKDPEMFKIAVYGGIISFLGIDMANGNITFNANDFHFKKLQLRASYAAPALWFPRALDLLKNKVVDPDDFITQTFPLEEIQKWFEKQRDDSSDVIKMVMVKE